MNEKPLWHLILETKELVRIDIKNTIDRDVKDETVRKSLRRKFPAAAAELFEDFWLDHRQRTQVFWARFYATYVTCHFLWAILYGAPEVYEYFTKVEKDLGIGNILNMLAEYEEEHRETLSEDAMKECDEWCNENDAAVLRLIK